MRGIPEGTSIIKMDITKLGREGMNWFHLAEDGGHIGGLL